MIFHLNFPFPFPLCLGNSLKHMEAEVRQEDSKKSTGVQGQVMERPPDDQSQVSSDFVDHLTKEELKRLVQLIMEKGGTGE